MDFVYIDEVQDLSMRQISLFKYICQNVDEGFVFAGDTAQTIARGIDFRFQDITSLFYKEFLTCKATGIQEKGRLSEIFQLKQNFRTHVGVLDLAQSVIDIFGSGPEVVGFGAEQVILVRDDVVKTEICEYIGKQALVLTIVECKGLEFQVSFLFFLMFYFTTFLGLPPLKDQWRVIYEYMKEHAWLDEKLSQSFPNFCESRHSVLCSELKQLYVAITRTRQRLWICENKEELSKPMFDYWKGRGLVQIRKLDDSVVQAMRVASSPQEWRERGKKGYFLSVSAIVLFFEKNYMMATMCFERAGDKMWETLAKASRLRSFGEHIRGTNPEAFIGYVKEAAGMFESIGNLSLLHLVFVIWGSIEEQMDAAAECFTLVGCYSDAAEAYAKGDEISKCLSVCRKGKLFDKGFQFIEQWKKHSTFQSKELELIGQEFLEHCALHFHVQKDFKSMMKFVRAFCSMESKRVFLKSLGCLDYLLILEEELGNFLDAAELARSSGDVLKEADLLEKAGHFKDAAVLLLWYVFFSSLWGNGNKGWPLKQFAQNEKVCKKAKLLAKTYSEDLYEFVCSELKFISDQHGCLLELRKDLLVSQKNKSLRGEIFLIRKILDFHIRLNFSKYDWEDELPININKHCEDKTSQNQVSARTLVFYWNAWKERVSDIFESLKSFHKEPNEDDGCVDFILNYFGVLETLEALHKSKSNGSAFHQSTSLLHIFEVSKLLLDCEYVNPKDTKKLERYLGISLTYFDLVFPLDWRRAVSDDLISLRETDLSLNLLEEIIHQNLNIRGDFTYWTIGRVMMICLRSRKPVTFYEHITRRINGILHGSNFLRNI
ncbi:putative TPR and ankyrin repeat-containing protein [Helianthus annuus]|nr:putative TPR and ankyrin repeat-containing protein [Helianthus annuus]